MHGVWGLLSRPMSLQLLARRGEQSLPGELGDLVGMGQLPPKSAQDKREGTPSRPAGCPSRRLGDQILPPAARAKHPFVRWGPVLFLLPRSSSCFTWEGFLPALPQLGTLPTPSHPRQQSRQARHRTSMSE